MARECRVGTWLFRINPKDERELQKGSIGSTSYSHLWSAPNGERILDIMSMGDEVLINTDRHNYKRSKHGGISLK